MESINDLNTLSHNIDDPPPGSDIQLSSTSSSSSSSTSATSSKFERSTTSSATSVLQADASTRAGADLSPETLIGTPRPTSIEEDNRYVIIYSIIRLAQLKRLHSVQVPPHPSSTTSRSPPQRSIKPLPRRTPIHHNENTSLRPVTPAFGISLNFTPLTPGSPVLLPSDKLNTPSTPEVTVPADTNTSYVDGIVNKRPYPTQSYTLTSFAGNAERSRSSDNDIQMLETEEHRGQSWDDSEDAEGEDELEQDNIGDDEEMEFDWDNIREIEDEEDDLEEEYEFEFEPIRRNLDEEQELSANDDESEELDVGKGQTELDAYEELEFDEDLIFPIPVKCKWMYQVAADAPPLACHFPSRSLDEAKRHARRHAKNNAMKRASEIDRPAVYCRWNGCDFLDKYKLDEFVTHYSVHSLMAARDS
ncbi:hypothetical protein J3R30DRAFT_3425159 [Lentinula aciculospora]|uniref:Uncharacterized protein n=1 Tax=Lentinula aciculospora TaxID=153920 RepID=A0A9W9AUD2_9AGAR|nr:hypothetical protein J3R30DRAFT_3425159 [Lentinula aciculospora]